MPPYGSDEICFVGQVALSSPLVNHLQMCNRIFFDISYDYVYFPFSIWHTHAKRRFSCKNLLFRYSLSFSLNFSIARFSMRETCTCDTPMMRLTCCCVKSRE